MLEPTSVQIASAAGIYRCSGLGQTKYVDTGEPLPPVHECKKGTPCTWELRKDDNMRPEDAIVVFVGRGIIHAIETDELPEVGLRYNVREAIGCGLQTGEHLVTLVEDDFRWCGKSYIRMEVERVGDLSDKLPIHQADQMTI